MTSTASTAPGGGATGADTEALYLDLLKGCLTRDLFPDDSFIDVMGWPPNRFLGSPEEVWELLRRQDWRLVRSLTQQERDAVGNTSIPTSAETMVGRARLDNVEAAVRQVLADGVPGDLVETGVWRGGTVIFMRALLATFGVTDRAVWACDSFQGLPEPDPERYPADITMQVDDVGQKAMLDSGLAISVDQVKANFERYGLLDDQVRFVEGWFSDSLPQAPIDQIAVLRLDGDLYESTIDALVPLEPKVPHGGYVIIDDYGAIDACRQAVHDYRDAQGITSPIVEVDWTGVYWRVDRRSAADR